MRIAPSTRVIYQNNPLAEVVCQIRFQLDQPFSEGQLLALLGPALESRFPQHFVEDVTEVRVTIGPSQEPSSTLQGQSRLHHFLDASGFWRVTACGEFIALTSGRYLEWADFNDKLRFLHAAAAPLLLEARVTRIGLRYKDLIARHELGLTGTPWTELLAPYLLGPLCAGEIAEGGVVDEAAVETHVFQSTVRLNDCKMLLQGGLMKASDGSATAFLVDADFFIEGGDISEVLKDCRSLDAHLEPLRANAGNLFRRSIKERLHGALKPS